MKRSLLLAISLIMIVTLVVGASTVMAAKPQKSGSGKDVIALSNGFPSGMHFNLNIHGKGPDYICSGDSGGNSVFVPEYGSGTIEYVSNKKKGGGDFDPYSLRVLDKCDAAFETGPDADPARVYLPYKVMTDEGVKEAGGYYVFARILGKPNNGKLEPSSNIILYPNTVIEACNDTNPENPEFPTYTECPEDPELMVGLIVGENIYVPDPDEQVLRRFEDPMPTKGRGKSRAVDITRLFTYTGWVVDSDLDFGDSSGGSCNGTIAAPDPDGQIDECDVPDNAWDIIWNGGLGFDPNIWDDHPLFGNNDDDIDLEEWLAYNADLALLGLATQPKAWYFSNHWIFDIADLVITEQGLENDGTKLVQLRFYPVVTTTFGSHIIVEKNAPDDTVGTAFGFDPSYGNAFSLRHGESKDSGALKAGSYSVTELLPLTDWELSQLEVIDLDPSTSYSVNAETAEIELAPGETVRVIFHNIPTPP